MTPEISERVLEEAIETALIQHGTSNDGAHQPGYHKRKPDQYDRNLCSLSQDLLDFVLATQPKQWNKLAQHHGTAVREQFLKRVSAEIERRGTLDVLRQGLKDSGCKFRLAYFQPASGLNEETRRLHGANLFAVVRQLHYSTRNENSLDLVLFLNGVPLFTAELKNPLTGQNVQDAIRQYKTTRDHREPLLAYGRCLGHFAADSELAYVASQLAGPRTRFLPFNQGRFGGAGNAPVPPTRSGYATAYLWEQIWSPSSVLDLVRQFIHEVEQEDDNGRKTGKHFLIFPRYQQLDCVRRLVADARSRGPGQRYLIQHSAGSGKSFTIAWLAHQLSTLHNASDARVFDSIVVITDRRILDRQLQSTIRQFEQTLGVVETIDTTSRQLKDALESGKTIIVTTLQKFPVIAQQIGELPGKRFAVIVDEAHSSQSGESTKSLKAVLSASSLEAAESEEETAATPEEELEGTILAEMEKRGRLPNVSTFAFTATPKPKTLELFGVRRPDGTFAPFHLYSMRQAIEERFILDVLANYTTYTAYWRLLKKVDDDPRYDKRKAEYLLKSFVELHPHAIGEKVRICVEHFATSVQDQIGGMAKAMVVTRSRLHAVRYKLAIDRYLAERGYPFKSLVAFSGTVQDGGKGYTESGMNGLPEAQTASTFEQAEFRFLIVANKFQTGFDQPLLHSMYVDKKLGGVGAVQTLSRLNRTHPKKAGTLVVDFANEADAIKAAFEPYFEATLLSEATDPNLLYEIETRLADFPVYTPADIHAFAELFFNPKATQDGLYQVLMPLLDHFEGLGIDERHEFRSQLTDYVRLYAFLAQVIPFTDADLEKLYQFARYLRRLLPADQLELPLEVQQNIDMESYRIQETSRGAIPLDRGNGVLQPVGTKGPHGPAPEELETLSRIVAELNERFGLNLGPEHRITLGQMMERLADDVALEAAARVNTRENVRLTFDQKVENVIQDIVDSNFDLYKRITDDAAFGETVKNFLFDQYLRGHRNAEELIKRGESKTLEFKSTLRWSLQENRKDDKGVTHAALKTIAAFLNTEGGDLLIGVADDGSIVGIEPDKLENDDKFMRHLSQVVRNGLGDRAGTCIDPKTQNVQGRTVCVVSCQRSPEPVRLRWKGLEATPDGDFFVRSGPGTVKLAPESATEFIRTRFPGFNPGP
ncbi:RNA-binding domain-containing protein [Cyanobium sp. Morenito 9A2]|uniref:RNA-binding domain-containing protein n=1 Tax=Cyanobium sp. Morenito 9A2 TaxID=2823718 RepID=UPI0020CD5103|nr:RNA-binding domain-containing protein [Cyanobium sp. Morenito 9A2]MCP9850842.1 putative DNA binding domain-containing protein [Cyanobium sp. Morenito 9A2]